VRLPKEIRNKAADFIKFSITFMKVSSIQVERSLFFRLTKP